LRAAGAEVCWSDPLVREWSGSGGRERSRALEPELLRAQDAVVLATDQPGLDLDLVAAHARLVVDTRNALASRMRGRAGYVRA
jgi:UDP-N-acetyl-D-glucosamine dehydrogenase